jgi:hypothetical protein
MAQAMKARQKTHVDLRNTLNELTSKQWIRYSESFWFQKGLGAVYLDYSDEPEASYIFPYE